MVTLLFDTYLTVFGMLVILLLVGALAGAIGWRMRQATAALKREPAGAPPLAPQELYEFLHSAVAHEFVRGLDYISNRSEETLKELPEEQLALREKQNRIIATAHELTRHAANIMDLYALPQESLQPELLNIKLVIESLLGELFSRYARSNAIRLMPKLIDIEPVLLSRYLTVRSLNNVIENAIKYSNRGGVVEVTLSLNDKGPQNRPGKWIWIDVKDSGKGIKPEVQDKIFEPRKRADGLVEPGSGLGLCLAREAARRQGGDVILVYSKVNEGSVFRIILPYSAGELPAAPR